MRHILPARYIKRFLENGRKKVASCLLQHWDFLWPVSAQTHEKRHQEISYLFSCIVDNLLSCLASSNPYHSSWKHWLETTLYNRKNLEHSVFVIVLYVSCVEITSNVPWVTLNWLTEILISVFVCSLSWAEGRDSEFSPLSLKIEERVSWEK